MLLILLLGLSALWGIDEVDPCLDPTDASYSCELSDDSFEGGMLYLFDNNLTTLPEGIFGGLTSVESLGLSDNNLTTLPEGILGGLTSLESRLYLDHNNLSTLPEGIFEGLTILDTLAPSGNNLECLPTGPSYLQNFTVDPYGDECGCSIADVTANVCGQRACTPGSVGYTCGDGVIDENDGPAAGGATPALTSEEGAADAEASGNGAMSAFSLPAGSVYAGVLGVAMAVSGLVL